MSLTSLLPPGLSLLQGIELFIQLIGDTTVVNRAAAAASTWLAYDICLTLAEEVELVWKARWSLPKVLYFLVRYYALSTSLLYLSVNSSPDPPFGLASARSIRMMHSELKGLSADAADGPGSRHSRALIAFCYTAEIAAAIPISVVEARLITILPRPANFPLPGCYTLASVPLRKSLASWVVNCTVATTFFALMLYKFFTGDAFKLELSEAKRNPLAKWTEVRRFSPLLYLLLRDGTAYFAMIFLVNAVNMALSIREEGRALEGMGVAWLVAVSSVASSRLLLNLRGFISGSDNMSGGKSQSTTMRFKDNTATTENAEQGVTVAGDVEECQRRDVVPGHYA
ncbi:hypothetical protein DICSQDRAFT_169834 [Dichomitus squalens LYAD-421 SS1]|uniref:DUF6533 domain-containing protein n=1 Tax=Dichomitus squalens (strain LYAD-421) TaxID=732165 RepID=R7T2P5_DICSQ|nr:uncharacterized protein DICSQDRAFT_169834 [Dichomitus squalens LYAD-421 SS1]EJF61817.1 hypothetical protein DICSQDRAFT_169834 [Dichomitus squalens LYAD-421 SS1]